MSAYEHSCRWHKGDRGYCCCFFSSRRRHTRYWRDWSSDVCSSDLTRSAATASSASITAASSKSRGRRRDGPSCLRPTRAGTPDVPSGSRRGSSSPLRLTLRGRETGRPSGAHAAVDVFQANDVLLVELAEGDLEHPDRALAHRREPVDRLPRYIELLLYRSEEHT